MKDLKKILLLDIAPPLDAALCEHLSGFGVTRAAGDGPFALVVSHSEKKPFPGCPILVIPAAPQRLGAILRGMARRLAEPALYLADIPLAGGIFRPREGKLEAPGGAAVDLTDREIDMLVYLARHNGAPVTRDDLLRQVWGYQDGVDTHTLETHIHRLRRKIGAGAIVTDAGGYSLGVSGGGALE